MQIKLLKHLNVRNILSNEQYGFRTKLKTDNAAYHLTNEILNALNSIINRWYLLRLRKGIWQC